MGEVLGGQSIIARTENAIPAQLPYPESIRTRSFARLPDKLRHYFRVELAQSGILGGQSLLTFQRSLPELAGKLKGLRPSFSSGASPQEGERLYDLFVQQARAAWPDLATGKFGADMQVALVNDGPVTFWLES